MIEDLRADLGLKDLPFVACTIGDSVHFDTAAQEQIGQRFAREFLRIVGE